MENPDSLSVKTQSLENFYDEKWTQEIQRLKSLSSKVRFLHTDVLYYRNPYSKLGNACYDVWKSLIKMFGGTINGYKELGHALGVHQDDLNYIANSVHDEREDIILKVFLQNEAATIDKITDALINMQRYDILLAIEQPLYILVQTLQKDDSGYHSNSRSTTDHRQIFSFKNLTIDLPPALRKKYELKDNDPNRFNPPSIGLPIEDKQITTNNGPVLFLTYTFDGLPTALTIQENVQTWTEFSEVNVITLNHISDEVYQNPEKCIREYFEKADFIVPIITNGYLNEIKSHNMNTSGASECLDHKYVKFIYNLIVSNYTNSSGCINKKVRSVLPHNSDASLYRSLALYPDLLPWTYASNFDEQFQSFLKAKYELLV